MIVNYGTNRQNNGYWNGQIAGAYSFDEDHDYLARYEEMVRSVTAKQLRDLAKRYIDLKNYAAVSLRPEKPDAGQAD